MTSNSFQLLRKTTPLTTVSETAETASNEPTPNPNEILMVYPSYSRQTDTGVFEVDVRGWLFLEGSNNRKSRILNATARKIAGIRQNQISRKASLQSLAEYDVDSDAEKMAADYLNDELTTTATAKSVATDYSIDEKSSEILRNRLSGFLTKSLSKRQIRITFSGLTDSSGLNMKEFYTETNSSGRFSLRLTLYKRPTVVSVEANEHVVSFESVINVDRYGVSVISDIDDTVKVTGILGSKRELFRNVFVHDYEKIAIEGVKEWYQDLSNLGVQFHYVSNSPWQLYPTIQAYLHNANLPRGSMHLKEYTGFLLNGLFESAGERKKKNLYKLLHDFPDRKFLLIGDSGEGDLEAYIDVACNFPRQILAICIRDVTMPDSGEEDWEVSQFRRNMIPRPDEIDMYEKTLLKSNKAKQRLSKSQAHSIKNRASSFSLTEQIKPHSLAHSNTLNPVYTQSESDLKTISEAKSIDSDSICSINDHSTIKRKSVSKRSVVRRKPVGTPSDYESVSVIEKNKPVSAPVSNSTNFHNLLDSRNSGDASQTAESLFFKDEIDLKDTNKPETAPTDSPPSVSSNQKHVYDKSRSTRRLTSLGQKSVARKPVVKRSMPDFLEPKTNPSGSDCSMNQGTLPVKTNSIAKSYTFDQSMSQNRPSASRVPTSSSAMLRAPSEDFELAELRDKRAGNWKRRVMRARLMLPTEIKLFMWKTGNDVRSECVDFTRREMMKIINV